MSSNDKLKEAVARFGFSKLPPLWEWTTVGDLGEVRLGRQRSPKNRSDKFPTKYLRAANITWNGLELSDVLEMEFKPEEKATYTLQAGDVILSEASGSPDEVGKPAVWNGELEECCFQNTVIRFRPSDAVISAFAHLIFLFYARNGIFKQVSKGVGIQHLGATRFSQIPFPVPPLPEQERIVAKTKELFSDLDVSVTALERAKANLEAYRDAVLKSAVKGQLSEEWRSTHPDVESATDFLQRILAERRRKWESERLTEYQAKGKHPPKNWKNKYPVPVTPEHFPPKEIPSSWCWVTIQQLTSGDRTTAYGVLQPGPHVEGGISLVRVVDVADGRIEIDNLKKIAPAISEKHPRSRLRGGEVLLTIVGTIGRTAVVPDSLQGANTARAVAVIPTTELISPQFLELMLRERSMKARLTEAAHEVARKTLNLENLRVACVPLAPFEEQGVVVAEVKRLLSTADQVEESIAAGLKRALCLRQSILNAAFEGSLVEQSSSDEPASELLVRIRRDRAAEKATPKTARRPKEKGRPKVKYDIRRLRDVIQNHPDGTAPDTLFAESGLDRESLSDLDNFYADLSELVSKRQVAVERPDSATVLIKPRSK